jgi:hypothetical protein
VRAVGGIRLADPPLLVGDPGGELIADRDVPLAGELVVEVPQIRSAGGVVRERVER